MRRTISNSISVPAAAAAAALVAAVLTATVPGAPARADVWPPTAQDVKVMATADQEEFLNMLELVRKGYTAEGEDGNPLLTMVERQSEQVAAQPKAVDPRLERGRILMDSGAVNKALEDFEAAIRLDPRSAAAWHLRGLAHERLGELAKAREFYLRAMELDPKGPGGIAAAWDEQSLGFLQAPAQKTIVERLGPPDSFSIVIIAEPDKPETLHRQESWYYYRLGSVFDFTDGVLTAESNLPGDAEGVAGFLVPPYRPYQFIGGIDFFTLTDVIGQSNYAHLALGADPLADGELVYAPMLAMGFKDGGLFYVRTIPFFMGKN
ncbi:MAG: tetratricopeptide repeat protein [Hyphomicrobiales bacterium]|nr:tetratricopeptide repeat protein [Hyphomicrobiales bacterium]MCP5374428.1 tetratricopeptide repeat protein [Hyphomicrobiales bacterium]